MASVSLISEAITSQSRDPFDLEITELIKKILENKRHAAYHESLVEYLTSAKTTDLQIILDEFKTSNTLAYLELLRGLPIEMQINVDTLLNIIMASVPSIERSFLNVDRFVENFLEHYLTMTIYQLSLRKKLSEKILDIVDVNIEFELGFIRKVFPGKERFSGNTTTGVNLAANAIADSMLGCKISPYLYLVPCCEVVGPKSKTFRISSLVLEFLKLKTTNKSIAFIQAHPEIRDCKYRQELQYQAFKAEINGNTKYSSHCTYQITILLMISHSGQVYIESVKRMGQPSLFKSGLNNTLQAMQERCCDYKKEFVDKFEYDFEPPNEPHAFVVDIPKDSEDARVEEFSNLPDQIKDALSSGDLDQIRMKFKELKAEDFKKYLLICAQQGFFYFATDIDMQEFGPYEDQIKALTIF